MDTPEPVNHVSLCAGYGGIDLGLCRCIRGLRTVAFSEIEAFAVANLVAKMEAGHLDAAPVWTNLKTFPWEEFRDLVDILSGGYPCQPFSAAGKRGGQNDPRHLWPFIADGIVRMGPGICFFENVEGHITLGLRDVLRDLARMGYRATWGIFSAAEVGAPHQRKRVFILAVADDQRERVEELGRQIAGEPEFDPAGHDGGDALWPSHPGDHQHAWEPPRTLADAERPDEARGRAIGGEAEGRQPHSQLGGSSPHGGAAESSLGGDADGPAHRLDAPELYRTCDNRTDELRLLGNGVVPATAARSFRTLWKELMQ